MATLKQVHDLEGKVARLEANLQSANNDFNELAQQRDALQLVLDSAALNPSDEFEAVVLDMVAMNRRKRADYASGQDILKNFRKNAMSMEMGEYTIDEDILSMIFRKANRMVNLRGRSAQNESVKDTAIDLAVYSVLLVIALEHKAAMEEMVAEVIAESFD